MNTSRIKVARIADNLSNGRCFVVSDCAVQGVLCLYFVCSKLWVIWIGRVKVSRGSFRIGGYGESARGVGWLGGVGEKLRESYAAEAILKER